MYMYIKSYICIYALCRISIIYHEGNDTVDLQVAALTTLAYVSKDAEYLANS